MTPTNRTRMNALAAAASNIPDDLRRYIAQEALESQVAMLSWRYYSMLRFRAVRTGAGPFTYTIDTSERKCFNYKQGDVMDAAGFAAGTVATPAETNILQASQTRDNADVKIWGICFEVAQSEPLLLRALMRQAFVRMSLSGNNTYELGRLSFFPQAGGVFGSERTKLRAGSLIEESGPVVSQQSNGNPVASSFFALPAPLVWKATGSGKKDTSLTVSVQPARAITETSTDRAAVAGAAPGASGQIEAFTSPADGADGTFVDLCCWLLTESVSPRSEND